MPSVNRHVSVLFHMGERFLNRALADTGITSGSAPLVLELRDGGDRNPAALAAAIGVDKGHVTRLLKTLKQDGYVTMAPDPSDGRMVTVSLTQEGRRVAGVAEEAIRAWLAVVSRGVAGDDLQVVEATLDAFYANAVRHFAEQATAARTTRTRVPGC